MGSEKIDYGLWQKLIFRALIGLAACQFVVEVVVNTLLYVTRQQGYNEDTIVMKLIRYQLLTTLFNVLIILACFVLCKKLEDNNKKKYILTLSMSLICMGIAYSHYQFVPTFVTFSIPLIFTIMYEDMKMCWIVNAVDIVLLVLPVLARGSDPEYNMNIVPETIITLTILFLQAIFSTFIIKVLITRRDELNVALVDAEKAKYVDVLNEKNLKLEELSCETFEAIAKAVDANDPYTAGHSKRVAIYSKMLASKLGLPPNEVDEIYYAGLIHDVGKLGVDNNIINKPGKLTDEEYNEVKRHPSVGYDILKGISIKGDFAYGAKCHHERPDGKGYPNGLKGDSIPFMAKVIAVADAYDAMTSKRSYRDVLPQDVVRDQIEKGMGTQFESRIACAMLQMIDEDVNYDMKQKIS